VRTFLFLSAFVVALAACHSSPSGEGADAGVGNYVDASSSIDASSPSEPDAATAGDAASLPDAATSTPEDASAAPLDASWDPAVVAPVPACNATTDSIYVTPGNLPPFTQDSRGDVIGCAYDWYDDAPAAQKEMAAANVVGVTAVSGVTFYRIAYRTTRRSDPGVSTARVYVPDTPATGPLPVIVAGHPTDGLADACAPSKDATSNREVALPWAALGYAVIVPDYAGLGNEGIQGYLDNRDTAHSLLDAARALRKFLQPGSFEPRVIMVGYSQGGGGTLAAQAVEKDYGAGGPIAAAIVFAPEWPSRLDSFGMVTMLSNPTALTITYGITKPPVVSMRLFSYFYNTQGASHATDGFPVAKRTNLDNEINSSCLVALGGWVQANCPHVSDLMDDALRTSFLACAANPADAACVEPGKTFAADLVANDLTPDPQGAPILYFQGLKDIVMPPNEEAACNIATLKAAGVTPQVCTDATAQHTDIVERNIATAIQWAQARLAGQALPTCSAAGMPACKP
jgi:dienelactone hydrolase